LNIFDELFERGMFVELTVFSAMKAARVGYRSQCFNDHSSTKNSPTNILTI